MNFHVIILILKVEENIQHFWHILLYYVTKGKNATEMQKKNCAVHGEGAVTDHTCQSRLQSSVLEISCRMMLAGQVHQSKLVVVKLRR